MKEVYNQPKFQEFVTAYEKAVEEDVEPLLLKLGKIEKS